MRNFTSTRTLRGLDVTPRSLVRLFAAAFVVVLLASPAQAAPAGADSEEATLLLTQLEETYELLTLEESWVLRPRADGDTFGVIEIRAGSVTVDGERMSRDELRDLIGDDADLMHSLAEVAAPDADPSSIIEEATVEEAAVEETEEAEVDQAGEAEAEEEPKRRRRVETDTRISFASSLTVEEHESVRDVVVIGGSLDVIGEIDGDAVAVGGSIDVRGRVDGSVTAVGGSVSLGPDAEVDGDVASIGGAVYRESGARVRGGITELSMGEWGGFDWDFDTGGWWRGNDFAWVGLAESITMAVLLTFFVLFTVLIARGYLEKVADRAIREPWKAGLVGLIAVVLFFPAFLLIFIVLCVSVIGIPLAILWIFASPLGLILMFLAGYSAIALVVGRKFEKRFGLGDVGPYLAVLLGIALIQGWTIIGEAFSFLGGPIQITAWLLILFGFLVKFVAWTVGLGAVLLHGFAPLPQTGNTTTSTPSPPPPPPPPGPGFQSLREIPTADESNDDDGDAVDETDEAPEDPDVAYSEAGEATRPKAEPEPPPEERPPEIEDGMYYSAGKKRKPPKAD